MIQQIPHVDQFKQQLRQSLRQEAQHCRTVQLAKHANIYTCGAQAETIYFIESGQVKLLMLSPEGNECLLAILTAGDIFGEMCLSGLRERVETATAMMPPQTTASCSNRPPTMGAASISNQRSRIEL